ncbi:MAG: HNH endonuclease [Bacteroidota bacterium]
MIKKLEGEKWHQVVFDNWQTMQRKYAISNQGRLASYTDSVIQDGILLKGSDIEGYKVLRLRVNGKYIAFLFHRLVAEYFLKKRKPEHVLVIHNNYKKQDNQLDNLRWATKEEVAEHSKQSPAVKAYRKKVSESIPEIKRGLKLTVTQVKQIKKLLQNPKRKLTYKQIAARYEISEMAITRINRGENWGYVSI